MPFLYEVMVHAQIALTGQFTADSAAEAVEAAKAEMLNGGQLGNVVVERVLLIDDDG